MKKILTLFSLVLLLLAISPVQGQTDTEFWFAVPKVTKGHSWAGRKFFFRFANLNLANTVTISMPSNPGFVPIVTNLAPNQASSIDVTAIIETIWTENPNQIYNRGIRISATNLTTAYFEIGTINNPDIFALKGKNALGTDFFVPFQDRFNNGNNYTPRPYSGIYIVATQDFTTITVTPTKKVFPGRPAGVPFDTILHMGQTIALVPDDYAATGQLAINHLGGTRVQSDKPIAIATSDDSVSSKNPNGWGGCFDLIGDQIVPVDIIGTEYIAMKGRIGIGAANSVNMQEYFYVVGTAPNTQVYIDGNLEAIIQPGEQFRWRFLQQNHHIETTNPAYVYHVAGFGCEMGGAILPPINVCTGSTKVSFTRSKGESFFLNILVRAGAQDGFIFNGNGPNTIINSADFVAIPGTTEWLAAEYQMNTTQVPVAVASLIENVKDVFHLGIINGGPGSGTMYGYFSDFNELDIKANISGTGSMHRACHGTPVQLIAQGGVDFLWSPPDYLDDPTSATPVALPDSSIKYTVRVSGACKMVDSTSVYISLYGPAKAAFTVSESEGCSPFTLNIKNESFGITNYSWRMGDGTVYTTAANELHHTFTNTTDQPIVRQLMLVGRYSMCRDTMLTNITIYPEINADMDASVISGCAPLEVDFQNYSTGAEVYQWKFGDGSSVNTQSPTHVFNNFSDKDTIYTVKLTAISKFGCLSEKTIDIHVLPSASPSFTFDPPASCSPYIASFNNTSTGATENLWSFNGGSSFEDIDNSSFSRLFENPTAQPDTTAIWLIAENAYGCRDTLVQKLTVYPEIKAEITTDAVEGCNPLLIDFGNSSTGASTFIWDFDNYQGTSSAVEPDQWFYNQSLQDTAYFNVKLVATSPWMCRDTVEQQIRVYPRIEAGFTFDHTSYCTPQEITFANTSLGASSFNWNFGDGSTTDVGTSQVSHFYENNTDDELQLPVQLVIENISGCRDTIVRQVIIYPDVKAEFSTTTEGCHPLLTDFSNESTGAVGYSWIFSDGSTANVLNPVKTFTNTSHTSQQNYQATLVARSQFGCTDTITREITVHPKPNAGFALSTPNGCAPLAVTFYDQSEGAQSLTWKFEDSSNITNLGNTIYLFDNKDASAHQHIIEMIAVNSYGCTDTTSNTVEVYPEIEARFEVSDISGCHPMETTITNLTEGASAQTPYFWDYGNGNQSTTTIPNQAYVYQNFSHTNVQHYTLKLNAQSVYGCKDSTETTITVFPVPKAAFSPSQLAGCSPLELTLGDESTGASQYQWNMGDGTETEQQGNISHTWHQPYDAGAGTFNIGLTVTNPFGCIDSVAKPITVYPDINASFEAVTEGCHPLPVAFSNSSNGADFINWSFGDGSESSILNPAYIFTNESFTEPKQYTVELNTQSTFGCQASTSKTVTVYPKPKSAFSTDVQEGCSPLPVTFSNESIGGEIFEWNLAGMVFNENQPNFGQTFFNLQNNIQTYNISLKTINEYGCSRESSQQVEVFPEVVANFTADNFKMEGCNPLPLSFENLSERADKYRWEFGDGNSTLADNPTYEFYTTPSTETTYPVKLTAESLYGCVDSVIRQAKVYPVPVADIFVSPHLQTFPSTSIRAENYTSPGTWQFIWDLGDGTQVITDNWDTLEHVYQWLPGDYSAKEYVVGLKVANTWCADSISQKISINAPLPVVGFEPAAQGCPPLDIQFRNDSQYGLEFLWDFNDGTTSTLENPMHVFENPGEYIVKLLVTGEGGLDSAFQTITVFEPPTADFRVTPEIVQLPYEAVQMVNLSSLGEYFEWQMGDGTIYYEPEPEHLYQSPGNYDITLTVGNNTFPQCFDQITKGSAVVAEQGCQLIFPNAFTPYTSGPSGGQYVINDPANNVFYPIHTGLQSYEMEIYNRWGELLFKTNNIDTGWDGYYQGELSPLGVYAWKVKATCFSGKKIVSAGDVTLYR